ncbi:UNVERIFIED_CONTAM: hypothetical protein Sradi_5273700 [Sesamum radiatum]|uniref:Uncharacterized protein n=1 Tax=Sesamum radiatum TaxID=300843 RepID=A0AAW2LMZ3_SESRA
MGILQLGSIPECIRLGGEWGCLKREIHEEEHPQPMKDDAASLSKESQAQEKNAKVEEKTPIVG